MIVPIGHENTESRRWPILTTILVAINVIVFIGTTIVSMNQKTAIQHAERELLTYWEAHPDLTTPPSLDRLGMKKPQSVESKMVDPRDYRAMQRKKLQPPDPGDQQSLDRMGDEILAILQDSPARSLGYVPKENNILGLFTSQFVHGGILHLVFNMWFMWLCACNLEDRWGRLIFLPVYLACGVVAALTQKLATTDSAVPLIGASGAVAGAMGAFLVTFAKTRIRFFHWILFRPGTFTAPAWVMLPLWLGGEIFWAAILPANADGTAHFAHIGGFAFGTAIAGLFVVTGIDRRLDSHLEAKITTVQDPRIVQASALIDGGRIPEALAALEAFLAADPGSIDGYFEYLRAATAVNDTRRMVGAYARLIDLHLRAQSLDAAMDFYLEVSSRGLVPSLPMRTRSELASRLATAQRTDLAVGVYAAIVQAGVTDIPSARAAMAYARLLLSLHRLAEAVRVLDAVQASNAVPELKGEIADLRARTQSQAS